MEIPVAGENEGETPPQAIVQPSAVPVAAEQELSTRNVVEVDHGRRPNIVTLKRRHRRFRRDLLVKGRLGHVGIGDHLSDLGFLHNTLPTGNGNSRFTTSVCFSSYFSDNSIITDSGAFLHLFYAL